MTQYVPGKKDLWFLPLGGSGEIGMNLNLYGHNGKWLMVDCGVTFGDRYGIEIITPDIDFIEKQKDNLAGLVVTHAHEDHVGAIPYLWQRLKCPVYATPFTANILRGKLQELPWGDQVPIHEIELSGAVKIDDFDISFIHLTHSIPEPSAVAIKTDLGTIFHTGDWKIDPNPLVGEKFDEAAVKKWGDSGIKALVCDSTNVFEEGTTGSEATVAKELVAEIEKHKDVRVVVTCFASNVARVHTIMRAAQETGRKVAFTGRSIGRMVDAAQSTGYLQDVSKFIDEEHAMNLPRGNVLLITTGSQGEGRSGLARIANMSHSKIRLDAGDVVIFSSRVIPGNEKPVSYLLNNLAIQGVKIVTAKGNDLHVSGHPSRDELRRMYSWVRPETLIPVHGEARHMIEHAALGDEEGIANTIVPTNGMLIDLSEDKPAAIDIVEHGRMAFDGKRMVPMQSEGIQERKRISINGTVSVSVTLDASRNYCSPTQVSMVGLIDDEAEEAQLSKNVSKTVDKIIRDRSFDNDELQEELRISIRRIFRNVFDKKPTVLIHLNWVSH